MALDADPQYYALDPNDTGAQPPDDEDLGLSPAIAALAQQLNVPYAQAAQLAANSSPGTGVPGAGQIAPDPNAPAAAGTSPGGMDALRALLTPQAQQGQVPPQAGGSGAGPLGVNPALDPNAVAQAGMASQGPMGLNAPPSGAPAPMVPPAQGTPNPALMPNPAQAPMPQPTYADTTAAPSLSALPPALQAIMQQKASQQKAGQPAAPGALPKHDNRIVQALGVLSALMGGPGAKIAGQYLQTQRQNDIEAQARAQQQTQQQFTNQTAQAEAGTAFVQNLAKLDDATQENVVRNLSPAQMMAAGFTPAQVKAEFFDGMGKFLPVTEADKPQTAGQQAQMLRAQAYSRDRLSGLTAAGQQALHDSMKATPDEFQKEYGLPYEGFTPLQTVRSVQGDARLGQGQQKLDQGDAALDLKTTAQQDQRWKLFLSMSPAMQAAERTAYASHPADAEAKYGRPYSAIVPGQTDANLIAQTGVDNRETDAKRTDGTRLTIAHLDTDTRLAIDAANNALAKRGQDLRDQLGQDQIKQRASLFQQRYGQGSAGTAEKQYQQIVKERLSIAKRLTQLATPIRDPDTGALGPSLRDQGRIDANPGDTVNDPDDPTGHRFIPNPNFGKPLPNPPATPAWLESQKLQQFDQQYQQQQYALKFPQGGPATPAAPFNPASPPATVAPAMRPQPGRGLMPAAVKVPASVAARYPASLGPVPGFDANAPGAAYTSHGSPVALPPALARTAQQPAARTGGTTPKGAAAAPRSGLIIQGTVNGQGILFHAPTSKAEFDAMTPLKRHAYVTYMRQKGQVR